MKRVWFQFVRKELEPERTRPEPEQAPVVRDAVADQPPEPLQPASVQQASQLDLRLSGDLWIFPEGTYLPIVMTGTLEGIDHPARLSLGPMALHLEVGETRQLTANFTRLGTDRFDVSEVDRPLSVQVRTLMGLAELRIGGLIANITAGGRDEAVETADAYAWGTGLFRYVVIKGIVYNEAFRIRLVELDQMRLIQRDQAWMGHLFQAIPDQVRSAPSRNLYRYLQAAATAADLMQLLRRATERVGRSAARRATDESPEERDDKAGQKVERSQDD